MNLRRDDLKPCINFTNSINDIQRNTFRSSKTEIKKRNG